MDKPILFQGEMVRAILREIREPGTGKTETRRVLKDQPDGDDVCVDLGGGVHAHAAPDGTHLNGEFRLPYAVQDRLWVRETWGVGTRPCPVEGWRDGVEYRADVAYLEDDRDELTLYPVNEPDDVCLGDFPSGWRPSIHMYRWASRITLNVTDVRVQRVREITGEDAKAEGLIEWGFWDCDGEPSLDGQLFKAWRYHWEPQQDQYDGYGSPIMAFRALWDSINAKPRPRYETIDGKKQIVAYESFPWDGEPRTETHRGKPHYVIPNPWVSAVTFDPVFANIDAGGTND